MYRNCEVLRPTRDRNFWFLPVSTSVLVSVINFLIKNHACTGKLLKDGHHTVYKMGSARRGQVHSRQSRSPSV